MRWVGIGDMGGDRARGGGRQGQLFAPKQKKNDEEAGGSGGCARGQRTQERTGMRRGEERGGGSGSRNRENTRDRPK